MLQPLSSKVLNAVYKAIYIYFGFSTKTTMTFSIVVFVLNQQENEYDSVLQLTNIGAITY